VNDNHAGGYLRNTGSKALAMEPWLPWSTYKITNCVANTSEIMPQSTHFYEILLESPSCKVSIKLPVLHITAACFIFPLHKQHIYGATGAA
jgi:hypothetical protein